MGIRIMIVDDEYLTRKALCEYIEWNKLGISEVMSASNGITCLKQCEETMPDIVVCDVRMSKMDGITLATKLRERSAECRIIFISGYANKEYLKSAITLKAVRYIEKPINTEELVSVVSECVESIRQSWIRREKQSALMNLVDRSQLIVQQEIVRTIYHKSVTPQQLRLKYGELSFDWPEGSYYKCCMILTPDVQASEEIQEKLNKWLESRKTLLSYMYMCGRVGAGAFCIIFQFLTTSTFQKYEAEKEILSELREAFSALRFSVACGKVCSRPEQLHDTIAAAEKAAGQWFYTGWNQINNEAKEFDAILPNVEAMGVHDRIAVLKETVRDLMLKRNGNPIAVHAWLEQIWKCTHQVFTVAAADPLAEAAEQVLLALNRELSREQSLDGLSRNVKDACLYILSHYNDTEMSVNQIARAIAVSPNYLCAIFKKETGITIKQYILKKRIEAANQLLLNTDKSIYEICDAVGYNNVDHFCKLYKREMLTTPSSYRKNGGGSDG